MDVPRMLCALVQNCDLIPALQEEHRVGHCHDAWHAHRPAKGIIGQAVATRAHSCITFFDPRYRVGLQYRVAAIAKPNERVVVNARKRDDVARNRRVTWRREPLFSPPDSTKVWNCDRAVPAQLGRGGGNAEEDADSQRAESERSNPHGNT